MAIDPPSKYSPVAEGTKGYASHMEEDDIQSRAERKAAAELAKTEREGKKWSDRLQTRIRDTEVLFERIQKTGLSASKDITAFSSSSRNLSVYVSKLEKAFKDASSKQSGSIGPKIKEQIKNFEELGNFAEAAVKMNKKVELQMSKLSASGPGKKGFSKLITAIEDSMDEFVKFANKGLASPNLKKNAADLADSLARTIGDSWRQATVARRNLGVHNVTAGVSEYGDLFIKGARATDKFLERENRVQQGAWEGRRALLESHLGHTYWPRRGGAAIRDSQAYNYILKPNETDSIHFTERYRMQQEQAAGNPAHDQALAGDYFNRAAIQYQKDRAMLKRSPAMGGEGGAGGTGLGDLAIAASSTIGTIWEGGKLINKGYNWINSLGNDAFVNYQPFQKAARSSGMTMRSMAKSFGIDPNHPFKLGKKWNDLGIGSWDQLAEIQGATGGGTRSAYMTWAAARYGATPLLSQIGATGWASYEQSMKQAGFYNNLPTATGGLASRMNNMDLYGLSPENVLSNSMRAQQSMIQLGLPMSAEGFNKYASFGTTSAIPSMRNFVDQPAAQATSQGQMFGAMGDPLITTMAISMLAKYNKGSTAATGGNINNMLKGMHMGFTVPKSMFGMFDTFKNMPQVAMMKMLSTIAPDPDAFMDALTYQSLTGTMGKKGAAGYSVITRPTIATTRTNMTRLGMGPTAAKDTGFGRHWGYDDYADVSNMEAPGSAPSFGEDYGMPDWNEKVFGKLAVSLETSDSALQAFGDTVKAANSAVDWFAQGMESIAFKISTLTGARYSPKGP